MIKSKKGSPLIHIRRNFSISVILAVSLVFSACGGGGGPGPVPGPDPTPKGVLTVTFDKNGGDTEASPTTITVAQKGETVTTLPKQPSRAGHAFTGWNTKADGSGSSFTDKTPVNESLTVYAQWHKTPPGMVTVGFDSNNGSPLDLVDIISGSTVGKPAADPGRTGYTFGGWYTDNGTFAKLYSFSAAVTSSFTLYAKWNPINYTVVFDKNDSFATGNMPNQGFVYDTAKNLPMNSFTRPGYTFTGWSTTAGGTVEYTDGEIVSGLCSAPGATVTLFAKWAFNPTAFTLGDTGPGGGKIFYIDPSSGGFTVYQNAADTDGMLCHYLEAAPDDIPSGPYMIWAPATSPAYASVPGLSVFPNTDDQAIGRGKKNTALILDCVKPNYATNAPAAYACDNYTGLNSTNDWFLPSLGELHLLCINSGSVGNLKISIYWSSSQRGANQARYEYSGLGGMPNSNAKEVLYDVRAIRAF